MPANSETQSNDPHHDCAVGRSGILGAVKELSNPRRTQTYIVLIFSLILLSGWIAVHKHAVRTWIALAASDSDAREYWFDKIDLAQETPKTLGGITPEESAYFRLKLWFEVTSLPKAHVNIFQTGPVNTGARLEMAGRTATLILKNPLDPSGVIGLVATQTLEENKTYYLDVEVLNGAFVSATLNGNTGIQASTSLIDVSDIRIGTGFSGERDYNGVLRNVSLTTGHASARIYNKLRFWVPIADKAFLAVLTLALIVWGARSRAFAESVAKLVVLQRKRRIFGGPWKMVPIPLLSSDADRLTDVGETKIAYFALSPLIDSIRFQFVRLFSPVAASIANFSRRFSIPALVSVAIVSGIVFATLRINGPAIVDLARMYQVKLTKSQVGFVNRGHPVRLTDVVESKDPYFEISLQFQAQGMTGHPNLFQTGDGNSGVRVELNDGTLAAIVGDTKSPGTPTGLSISQNLELNRWHELRVAALNDGFVTVQLDDNPAKEVKGENLAFAVDNFWVGQGFDSTRQFEGDIRNVQILHGEGRSHSVGLFVYRVPMGLSFISLIGSITLLFARLLPLAKNLLHSASDRLITIRIGIFKSVASIAKRFSVPALVCIALVSACLLAAVLIEGSAVVNSVRFHELNLTTSQVSLVSRGHPIRLTDGVETKDAYLDAYFDISLQFQAQEMAGYPNLFQTGDGNSGVRVELSDGTLAAIVGNAKSPGTPTGLIISKNIELNKWHDLRVTGLNRDFVTAQLDDAPAKELKGETLAFVVDNFWIGQGLDSTRGFTGDIRNVQVLRGEGQPNYLVLISCQIILDLSLLLLIGSMGLLVARSFTHRGAVWHSYIPESPIWRSAPDRRVAILIGCLGIGDFIAWAFSRFLLPKIIAPALGLDPESLPLRAPLFEGSSPYTDFTEVTSFPNYVSKVSWATPPAEQIRIMLKSWFAQAFPTLWEMNVPFFLFVVVGMLLHLYGMLRLANVIRGISSQYQQRLILFFLLILTLYPIHFAFDRGNAALHNTGFVILGAAYFLEGSAARASCLFVLSAVSKITPVAFALSFLLTRQWRGIFLTIGLTSVGIVLPAVFLYELIGYNLNWMIEGQRIYTEEYAVKPDLGLGFSTSLFSAFRFAIIWFETFQATSFVQASAKAVPLIRNMLPIYSVAMAVVGLDLLIQAWRRRVSPEIFISLLAIYQVMAPHIIADYYLTLLVIPLLVFCYCDQLRPNFIVPMLLVLILIPKSYLWMPTAFSPSPYWISWGVFVNGTAITALYFYIRMKYAQTRCRQD